MRIRLCRAKAKRDGDETGKCNRGKKNNVGEKATRFLEKLGSNQIYFGNKGLRRVGEVLLRRNQTPKGEELQNIEVASENANILKEKAAPQLHRRLVYRPKVKQK